jgi:hypothetical protein
VVRELVFEAPGLVVYTTVGPASEGDDRRRWQFITVEHDNYCTLTCEQIHQLARVLLSESDPD